MVKTWWWYFEALPAGGKFWAMSVVENSYRDKQLPVLRGDGCHNHATRDSHEIDGECYKAAPIMGTVNIRIRIYQQPVL